MLVCVHAMNQPLSTIKTMTTKTQTTMVSDSHFPYLNISENKSSTVLILQSQNMTFQTHIFHNLKPTLTPKLYIRPNLPYPNTYTNSLVLKQKLLNPKENNENDSRPLKILLYPTSKIPSLSLNPYTPWSTAGGIPMELRGDQHSLPDHQKTTLFIPRCLATGGKNYVEDHRQNRMKQSHGTMGHFRKNILITTTS